MRTIKLGFSRPSKEYKKFPIFSWIIRLFEWTPYSHIYAEFKSESLSRRLVYEASGLSVKFLGGKLFDTRVEKIYEYDLEITESEYKKTLQFAIDNAGKPYGILQIFGLGWVILGRWFGKRWKNPFSNGNQAYVCSELVIHLLPELRDKFGSDPDVVTPRDIWEYLEEISQPSH